MSLPVYRELWHIVVEHCCRLVNQNFKQLQQASRGFLQSLSSTNKSWTLFLLLHESMQSIGAKDLTWKLNQGHSRKNSK